MKTNHDDIIPRMGTINQAADLSGLSKHFVRKLCTENKIVYIRSGSKYLINLDRFIDFLNGGEGDQH